MEKQMLCDNCHRNYAILSITDIGIYRRDLILCKKCAASLLKELSTFLNTGAISSKRENNI